MFETILVVLIVAAAGAWGLRRLFVSAAGKESCSCARCGKCAYAKNSFANSIPDKGFSPR